MRIPALVVLLVLACSVVPASPGPAAAGAPLLPLRLQGFAPAGQLPPSALVLVTFSVPLRNAQLLSYYAQGVSTPGSPMYRHFLSKGQVAALFYPTASYHSLLSFLSGEGLKVTLTAADSLVVAQGNASQFSRALGLSYELYSNGTTSYYSARGPATVAGARVYSSNITAVFFSHPSTLVDSATLKSLRSATAGFNNTFAIEAYPLTALGAVYNATSMYRDNVTGKGYNVGIFDYYGDPYIAGQLQYFDGLYNLSAPPSFSVVPIGPYDPNLGMSTGWAGEIGLDVEAAHAIAPGAGITLYVANGALPLSVPVATVQAQGAVSDLSQSFSIPESFLSTIGPSSLYFNVMLTDTYYMMGTVEGITFTAATGDAGGSGYSAGPEGTPGYPSTSPFVTAVGGTTTYVTFGPHGVESSNQTAWSNYGFVPFQVNYGGSTGGVSVFEPKPWYQSAVQTPAGYPDGREVPDVSLNANVFPGVLMVDTANQTEITGGTSEASPLLAGLLTLVMQRQGGELGLLNPSIYAMAEDPPTYAKAFDPIAFGYNIPWVAAPGYDMVTGWGSINVGEFAYYYSRLGAGPSLSVQVGLYNSSSATPEEFMAGSQMTVVANITAGGLPVLSGTFQATLQTLQGSLASATLSPSGSEWKGQLTVPSQADGVAYVTVSGSSAGRYGSGMADTFTGYLMTYETPSPSFPYAVSLGTPVTVQVTDLEGSNAPLKPYTIDAYSYDPATNGYSYAGSTTVSPVTSGGGTQWVGSLSGSYPEGPVTLVSPGAYGYLPFMNGIDLQTMFVLPPVVAEPGGVSPGQAVTVAGYLYPPLNTFNTTSDALGGSLATAIAEGSNVSAQLVGPSGSPVSSAEVRVLQGALYYATLPVPEGTPGGLYTVTLRASYDSSTLGTVVTGGFFGQIYVSPLSGASISVSPRYAVEGQTLYVYANITGPAGREVTQGMYSASIYPANLKNFYSAVTTLQQTPLWYNSTAGLWEGNATLPSTNDLGSTPYLGAPGYYSGEFEVFVSGVSPSAMQTSTDQSSQYPFYVLPYTMVQGRVLAGSFQTSGVAYYNDTIASGRATLSNDVFLGSNTLKDGSYVIYSSSINGTVRLENASLVFVGGNGGDMAASNSSVTLVDSYVGHLTMNGSVLRSVRSTYAGVNPAPAVIRLASPANGSVYLGFVGVDGSVSGDGVSNVSVYLDGRLVHSVPGNGTISYGLGVLGYPDGTHQLQVVATQADGVSSSVSVTVSVDNQGLLAYPALALAAAAVGLAVYMYRKKPGALQPDTSR
ncbi:MAG: peptidase S8 [Nitrososphaerota archaeon]|nr:peptidase S8 [Nitrososphaerota archaeon]